MAGIASEIVSCALSDFKQEKLIEKGQSNSDTEREPPGENEKLTKIIFLVVYSHNLLQAV
jgi:hypothetical protein